VRESFKHAPQNTGGAQEFGRGQFRYVFEYDSESQFMTLLHTLYEAQMVHKQVYRGQVRDSFFNTCMQVSS